jgi:hypothetical protein
MHNLGAYLLQNHAILALSGSVRPYLDADKTIIFNAV